MKLRVFVSHTYDPWFNLATEDWIFEDLEPDCQVLFLWRNQKTVVIGRSQNPWAECKLEAMEAHGVKLARRQSGGGAVFHDLGNSNFTFLSPKAYYDKAANLNIIATALDEFGIKAYASGRNDMLVATPMGERKISGSAFREKADRAFHHGTLMLNVNLDELTEYLNPHPKKLAAKGVQSVRARVMNLNELNPNIHHTNLSEAIVRAFFNHYGARCEIEVLDYPTLAALPALQQRFKALSDWEWRFGKTLPFSHELHEKLSFGCVSVLIHCNEGMINHTQIYSDCLDPDWIDQLSQALQHVSYSSAGIAAALKTLTPQGSEQRMILNEFNDWLSQAVQ